MILKQQQQQQEWKKMAGVQAGTNPACQGGQHQLSWQEQGSPVQPQSPGVQPQSPGVARHPQAGACALQGALRLASLINPSRRS